MSKTANLIFPNQLFENHSLLENEGDFYLIEEYLFFKEFYPQLRVYAVQYINNNLNVYLHDNEYISASLLENIQNEFKKHFQTKMGIYLKNINFIFKYE